jgi:hypothetical protein
MRPTKAFRQCQQLGNLCDEIEAMPAKKSQPKKRAMSSAHKSALAEGRTQGRAVRMYLDALEANKPKRGRKRTPDSIAKRIETIDATVDDADRLTKLHMIQERQDLENELAAMDSGIAMSTLEEAFIEVAAEYGAKKGIAYATWREIGVSAAVLKQAGVSRGA